MSYVNADGAVKVDFVNGKATGADGTDTLDNVNSVYGSSFADVIIGAGNDSSVSVFYGAAGADTIDGGKGNDRIVGGAGNDQLTGGLDNDVFVFAGTFGKDTITDFKAGPDVGDQLQINSASAHSFSEVLSHANQVGADCVITLGLAGTITLENVEKSALAANDFDFV